MGGGPNAGRARFRGAPLGGHGRRRRERRHARRHHHAPLARALCRHAQPGAPAKDGRGDPAGRGPDSDAEPPPRQTPHPLRPDEELPPAADQPPLQIAAIKFAFTLPGHAGVSHAAQLVVQRTDDSWSDYFTPLSWKMNRRQCEALDVAWHRIARSDLGSLSPLDEPLYFAPGDTEPSLTLDDLFERVAP